MSENGTAVVTRATTEQTPALSAFGSGDAGFDTAQRIAKALASSTMVPAAYQGSISNCLVAMEYAHRIGASVLAVMQNMDLIHGKPGLRSTFLIGTVNASGRFTPVRFRWQGEPGTDTWGCRAVAKDRESGEECLGTLITIRMAKEEGWYSRNGSKWKTMPEQMLMYRAATFWTRIYCPELSLGLHSTDEIEDMGPPPEVRARALSQALDAGDGIPLGEATVVSSTPAPAPTAPEPPPPPRKKQQQQTEKEPKTSAQVEAARKILLDALERHELSPIEDDVQQWLASITGRTGDIAEMTVAEMNAVVQRLEADAKHESQQSPQQQNAGTGLFD